MNLKDKVVIITGGSRGLGEALSRNFKKKGALVIVSARNSQGLSKTAKEVGVSFCIADVTKEKDMIRLARYALEKFGRIDVWVNNAGVTLPHTAIENVDMKLAHRVMEVNLFGTFNGSRVALRQMKKQKSRGTIVNVVSMSSLVGRPQSSAYSVSKWAVRGFTESLRMAAKPHGIHVIAIHPGGIKTTFNLFKGKNPPDYDRFMEPEYVARRVIDNLKKKNPRETLVVWKKTTKHHAS